MNNELIPSRLVEFLESIEQQVIELNSEVRAFNQTQSCLSLEQKHERLALNHHSNRRDGR